MPFRKTLIAALLFFLFSGALINPHADEKQKPAKYPEIKCDFKLLPKYFYSYKDYYPILNQEQKHFQDWSILSEKYTCEEVRDFIMKQEKKFWTINVKQIMPKEGIETGVFIAYGHYIKPPYKVEKNVEKETVTVNGVSIIPGEEPNYAAREESYEGLRYRRVGEIGDEIRKLCSELKAITMEDFNFYFSYLKRSMTKEQLLERMEEHLKNVSIDGSVVDYWIYDKEKLLFDIKLKCSRDWDVPERYYYTPEEWAKKLEEDKEREKRSKKDTEYHIDSHYQFIVDSLNSGKICFADIFTVNPEKFIRVAKILLADKTDFEKIILIVESAKFNAKNTAKLLVFNSKKEDIREILKRTAKSEVEK